MNKASKQVEKQVRKTSTMPVTAAPFLFGKRNYIILLAGIVLMAFGFLIMRGGSQSPDQWDPKVIYGFSRITISTIVVVLGLIVVLLSIFAKHRQQNGI